MCVCVCVCVCVHTYMYIHIYICIYIYILYIYVCVYKHIHIHIYPHIYIYIYMTYICMYILYHDPPPSVSPLLRPVYTLPRIYIYVGIYACISCIMTPPLLCHHFSVLCIRSLGGPPSDGLSPVRGGHRASAHLQTLLQCPLRYYTIHAFSHLSSQTVHTQRGHEHTRTGNRSHTHRELIRPALCRWTAL